MLDDPTPERSNRWPRPVTTFVTRLNEQRSVEYRLAEKNADVLSRRRWVAAVVVMLGAVLLALALRVPAGDPMFYVASAALAAVWFGGWLLSGRTWRGESADAPLGLGAGALLLVIFLLGASVVAQIDSLREPVDALLAHARWGSLPLVALITAVSGVAEELFFRGALYDALFGKHPVIWSTVLYTLVTALSGIVLLAFAAAMLGLMCAWLRRITGGVTAPILAHVTWSLGMLFLLGPVLELWR